MAKINNQLSFRKLFWSVFLASIPACFLPILAFIIFVVAVMLFDGSGALLVNFDWPKELAFTGIMYGMIYSCFAPFGFLMYLPILYFNKIYTNLYRMMLVAACVSVVAGISFLSVFSFIRFDFNINLMLWIVAFLVFGMFSAIIHYLILRKLYPAHD